MVDGVLYSRRRRPKTMNWKQRLGFLVDFLFLCMLLSAEVTLPDYSADQLRDRAFIESEIARYRAMQTDLQARKEKASPLLTASLEKDLRRVAGILDSLNYIHAKGYEPSDPELQKLPLFAESAELKIRKGPAAGPEKKPAYIVTGERGEKHIHGFGNIPLANIVEPDRDAILYFHPSTKTRESEKMQHWLTELQKVSQDLRVFLVETNGFWEANRYESDLSSPIAQQFGLPSVPYFIIYTAGGKTRIEGEEARALVDGMMAARRVYEKWIPYELKDR